MKIDFIHIGYHKTASSYLQNKVFPLIDNLTCLNGGRVSHWFFEHFINVNAHAFDKEKFLGEFHALAVGKEELNSQRKINCLSDENLSGDIYTGLESRERMLRLHDVFNDTKILIVIRNQVDYILSAYSNYVLHGGTKTIPAWLVGQETRFGQLFKKLMYSYLIKDYMSTFGQRNVFVVQHELLFDDSLGIGPFLSEFGLQLPVLEIERTNSGRNLMGNYLLLSLNKIGLANLKGRQCIFTPFKSREKDRSYVKSLITVELEGIYEDNRRIEALIGQSLVDAYYG